MITQKCHGKKKEILITETKLTMTNKYFIESIIQ